MSVSLLFLFLSLFLCPSFCFCYFLIHTHTHTHTHTPTGKDESKLISPAPAQAFGALLGLTPATVTDCFTHQTIQAGGQAYQGNLSADKAVYGRDALAKVCVCVCVCLTCV